MLDGLHLYEVILGALGTIGFLALLVLVIRQVLADKPYGGLLSFMILPGVMVAWPSIQSFKLSGSTIEIAKATQALRENPGDVKAREDLKKSVEAVQDRPISSPEAAGSIAAAQFELGNEGAAEASANKALQNDPQAPVALAVKRRIELARKLPVLTRNLEQAPTEQKKAELEAATQEATSIKTANPELLIQINQAQKATSKMLQLQRPPSR